MNFNSKTIAYISIGLSAALTIWYLTYSNVFCGSFSVPDLQKIKNLQPFVTGITTPLITFGTSLLVIETLKNTILQNVSNNFFKLIDQNRKILDNVNTETKNLPEEYIKSTGKDFFDDLCERIANAYNASTSKDEESLAKLDEDIIKHIQSKTGKELVVSIFDHFYQIHQSDLGHYYRNLYYIVRYVDRSRIRKKDKVEFINILRSQLSNYELLSLAYNAMNTNGAAFKEYILKYELLKSVNNESQLSNAYTKRIVDLSIISNEYPFMKKYWKI